MAEVDNAERWGEEIPPPPMPKSIRVGCVDIEIVEWPPIDASASGRFGEFDNMAGVIKVRSDLKRVEKANTLLHELLHAAHHVVRWADSPALRVDPGNGMTLCSDCHLAAHGRKRH